MAAAQSVTLSELAIKLDAASGATKQQSYQVPLKQSAVAMRASILSNFAGGHDPDGNAWAPLLFKRARGGTKPLRDTDVLMASATGKGQGGIERMTDTELVMGTNLDRAAIHQYGGTITPKKGKYLSIPLTRQAAGFDSPTEQPGIFLFKTHRGKAFLATAEQKGKGKRQYTLLTFHWLLLAKVKIKARPFIGFGAKLIETISNIFGDWYEKQVLKGL